MYAGRLLSVAFFASVIGASVIGLGCQVPATGTRNVVPPPSGPDAGGNPPPAHVDSGGGPPPPQPDAGSGPPPPGPDAYVPPAQPDAAPVGGSVSYSNDVAPLFNSYGCNSCHGGEFSSYSSIVNQSAYSGCSGWVYIKPNDPANSAIYSVVATSSPCAGQQMPPSSSGFSSSDINTLKTWINEGAPNN